MVACSGRRAAPLQMFVESRRKPGSLWLSTSRDCARDGWWDASSRAQRCKAHGFPCLVHIRVGQLRRVAQQARAREHFAPSCAAERDMMKYAGSTARTAVESWPSSGLSRGIRCQVHEVESRRARCSSFPSYRRRIFGALGTVKAHVGHRERLPSVLIEGDRAVDGVARRALAFAAEAKPGSTVTVTLALD